MDHIVFPFLSLPQRAQVTVLNTMKLNKIDILSLSFCSKRTKNLAISVNLYAASVAIYVQNEIRISLHTSTNWFGFDFYHGTGVAETDESIPLPLPDAVNVRWEVKEFEMDADWRKPEYTFKDWVEHLLTVFHHPEIDDIFFQSGHGRFDAHSISEALKMYDILCLMIGGPTNERARIADRRSLKVLPDAREMHVLSDPFEEAGSIQKVLIKNYDRITLHYPLPINDLLIVNSSVITIYNCDWSEKSINRLLKLWIRGSNPRLEHLRINLRTEKDERLILKGIKHTKVSEYQRRSFRTSASDHVNEMVRGGYDIKRHRDGTLATITVKEKWDRHFFDMYVWSG